MNSSTIKTFCTKKVYDTLHRNGTKGILKTVLDMFYKPHQRDETTINNGHTTSNIQQSHGKYTK